MKKSIKFSAIILALIIMAISVFSGCGNGEQAAKKIGIIQFMPHSSLDNCCQGIKNILDKNNIAYEVQIGSSTSPTEDCQSYAARMASDGQYDMIIAIATPAATAAYSAVRNASSDIPVIFCAVSDPVAAKLVESTDKPGNNCTGTSDAFDIPSQVKMIKAFQPDLAKLGVI